MTNIDMKDSFEKDFKLTYKCTCSACPTQYEGQIDDLQFYFRYRWGTWRIQFHQTDPWADDAIIYSGSPGEQFD